MACMKTTPKVPGSSCQGRMNLRLPSDMLGAIDADRSSRPGNISRNTWILEAVAEKLRGQDRELAPQLDEAGNG